MKLRGLCEDCIHNEVDCEHFINIEKGGSINGKCIKCKEYKSITKWKSLKDDYMEKCKVCGKELGVWWLRTNDGINHHPECKV